MVSPLLRLPGELRNRIYGYVFDYKTLYFEEGEGGRCIFEGGNFDTVLAAEPLFRTAYTMSATLAWLVQQERVTEPLSLTWTCRQTRAETMSHVPKWKICITRELTREVEAAELELGIVSAMTLRRD